MSFMHYIVYMNNLKNALNKITNAKKMRETFLATCNAEINTGNTQLIICFGQPKIINK